MRIVIEWTGDIIPAMELARENPTWRVAVGFKGADITLGDGVPGPAIRVLIEAQECSRLAEVQGGDAYATFKGDAMRGGTLAVRGRDTVLSFPVPPWAWDE